MSARRIGWSLGAATLVASGAYVFVYLYRWEWNRALTAGLFFVAAEIGLATALLVERLRRVEHRVEALATADDASAGRVRARLTESAPPGRDHFAWMRSSLDRTSVFIPVLMGAGVILSALAWAVERLARVSAGPALERGLARRLVPITVPDRPLVVDAPETGDDALTLLRRPSRVDLR